MGDEYATSAALKVAPDVVVTVKGRKRYVSRGGLKLEGALRYFEQDVQGLRCIDVGCSTGGFTDVLLGCGAALYRLNRLRSGEFSLDDAVDVETIRQWTQDDLDNWITGFLHNRLARMTHFSNF